MKGTCQICGCTQEHACDAGGQPCAWIDDLQDFCSRCARELLGGLHSRPDVGLAIRALSCAVLETAGRLELLEQMLAGLVDHLARAEPGGEIAIEVPSGIWTPE